MQQMKMKYWSSCTVPFSTFRQYSRRCAQNPVPLSPAVVMPIISLLVYAAIASCMMVYCFAFLYACISSAITMFALKESCASGLLARAFRLMLPSPI